ncbi:MAG: dUTP diphosphatase [Oligoflexia bacterium]|nr:dUTP diphosphatase [Oligoflexia bacterium]
MILPLQVLAHAEGLPLPAYKTAGSAGMDLCAALPADQPLSMQSLDRALVPTGLRIAVPQGFEAQIRPRSGNALRLGLGLVNSPGTIDSDYRGEVKVILVNLGRDPVTITRGMRIAQLVVCPVVQAVPQVVTELDATARGAGGFGSTGQ